MSRPQVILVSRLGATKARRRTIGPIILTSPCGDDDWL